MKALYDSPWHHPFVAYAAGLILLFAIARQLPFLYGYLTVFLVAILADATATGSWSPVPLNTPTYTVFSVVFIILGDLRYFLLCERVSLPEKPLLRTLLFSVPMSFVVPVTTFIMTKTIDAMRDDRLLYIVYESAMGFIVLGLDRYRFGARPIRQDAKRWVHEVSVLFATLYFGWAACDVLIILDIELGHLLRIVPNVLYYGAFLPFVFWRAPRSARALS